jgi:hypothetical protein
VRARAALAGAVAVGVLAIVAIAAPHDPPAPFAQRSVQEIPGTLGLSIGPPRAATVIGADRARDAMGPTPEGTALTLAAIRDPLEDLTIDPAWVGIARGLCLRDAKGELVSDARGPDPGDELACTDATFQVIAVDAVTGRLVLSTTGYDASLAWVPDVSPAA